MFGVGIRVSPPFGFGLCINMPSAVLAPAFSGGSSTCMSQLLSPVSAHMCDNAHMDTTIRNLDPRAYRAFKAQASLQGRTIGDAVNEAIRVYVGRPGRREKTGTLRSLQPREFPPGNERLSEEIDAVVYGN